MIRSGLVELQFQLFGLVNAPNDYQEDFIAHRSVTNGTAEFRVPRL